MSLTEKDLKSIAKIFDEKFNENIKANNEKLIEKVKDIVDFAIEKSELKLTARIDAVASDLAEFREEMSREISDIAEMNREFITRTDNHENRIQKLELKTGALAK